MVFNIYGMVYNDIDTLELVDSWCSELPSLVDSGDSLTILDLSEAICHWLIVSTHQKITSCDSAF